MNWYKICKLSSIQKLAGEYWIQGGQAVGADGDIGDYNHNMYVAEAILSNYDIEPDELHNLDENMMRQKGFTEDEIKTILYMHGIGTHNYNPRVHGMKYFGWKRIMGQRIETWTLTQADLRDIYNGIYDLSPIDFDSEDEQTGYTWDIEVVSTRDYYPEVPESVIGEAARNGDMGKLMFYKNR
jgi:hypothetical protein